jgi:hypothetical protein
MTVDPAGRPATRWCPDCGAPVRFLEERVCAGCGYPLMFLDAGPAEQPPAVGRVPGEPGGITVVDAGPLDTAPLGTAPLDAGGVRGAEEPLPAGGVRCPHCGYGNAAARVLCQRCGFALRQQSRVSGPGAVSEAPGPEARSGGWRVLILLVVVAAVLALAAVAARALAGSG